MAISRAPLSMMCSPMAGKSSANVGAAQRQPVHESRLQDQHARHDHHLPSPVTLSASTSVPTSSSTPLPATTARCVRNARAPRPEQDARSPSPTTNSCSTGSESSSPRREDASDCASGSRSSTASLTSSAGKAAAPATVRLPCRIWRQSTPGLRQRKIRRGARRRDDSTFKPFGVLAALCGAPRPPQ